MKWLVINTEAFSPKGLKDKKEVTYTDLPWVVQKFLSAFPYPFIILDESSKIKTNTPMKEDKKSSRTRTIKLLNKFGERCAMTGTLKSKSPLNVIDQYDFLKKGYIPENMWEFAERYCIMETIRVGRGRRVLISQKDYDVVRKRLRNAYIRGGNPQLEIAKQNIFKQYSIDPSKLEHIIRHKKYSPFINQQELLKRLAPITLLVKREDVFDIKYDKFVKNPIMRPVELGDEAKRIGSELVTLGITDNMVLGKAAALELMLRLQDVCNGFEPVKDEEGNVTYKKFAVNPKVDSLIELLEEIDTEKNQVVVWSSRKLLLSAIADRLTLEGITFVRYDGDSDDADKAAAEAAFKARKVSVFLANQSSGAFGLNCLSSCSYAVYMCIDGSVEKYYQSQHRILRGTLTAPKFAYHIYAKGSLEEKQQRALAVGQELLGTNNSKDIFTFS